MRRDPLASSANGWYVTFGCHPPSRQGTEVPRRETGCGNGDGVSESDSHCHGVSVSRPDVVSVGSRPEGLTGERHTYSVADPDSRARSARADRGPPDAGGAARPTLSSYVHRPQLTSTTKKKNVFLSKGTGPLFSEASGWRKGRADGTAVYDDLACVRGR